LTNHTSPLIFIILIQFKKCKIKKLIFLELLIIMMDKKITVKDLRDLKGKKQGRYL